MQLNKNVLFGFGTDDALLIDTCLCCACAINQLTDYLPFKKSRHFPVQLPFHLCTGKFSLDQHGFLVQLMYWSDLDRAEELGELVLQPNESGYDLV